MKSKYGCKVLSMNAIWKWIQSNKWVFFIASLLVGFFVCFFGRKLYSPIFFISGVLVSVSLIYMIFYSTFLSDSTENWVGWVVLIAALLVGLFVGYIFMKIVKLGAFALAAWGGYSLGLLLYNMFLY